DELRSVRCDVKVEAEKDAAGPRHALRNPGCVCEYLLAKGRQADDGFDRADHALHFARVFLRHEYRYIGEKMRMRFDQIELLPQGRQVASHAVTFAAEAVGEPDGDSHDAAFCSFSRRPWAAPMTAPTE